ncbi:protein C11orf74 homolog isoform X2 [Suricata suricatta]|uniref:Intraflagellar transport associated protein n=1 Tax=Suricata suricatta TaxID=37032 RepID=A0A673UJ94_SURSU|nr:protein C11orf74 homolog isoform X2 [Suricata suricatta]
MPAQISELETMDEDRLIEDVLDKFVNCHEQTYEEFLSTFTHLSKDLPLLPGEVEEDVCTHVPSHIPSVAKPFTSGVELAPVGRGARQQMEEVLGDAVQPFSLDEEFDYDAVVLTPKFTPAEMDALTRLSRQQSQLTSTDLEEPHD